MKLSDYVLSFVADLGVKHVFLVVGGGAMHLNNSLASEERLIPVCNLHEQASAIAAENYSKATNHLGVCLVTTGPGATNAITGVAGAWLDSTPTLYISGQVKRPDRAFDQNNRPLGVRQVGVQEVDIVSLVSPITKYAVTVLEPNDIRYHLEKAHYLAVSGRPGPVWIDIPLDVQATPIEDPATLKAFDPNELSTPSDMELSSAKLDAQAAEILKAINTSERPMLLIGNGVRLSRAENELQALLRVLDIPAEVTWLAIDLMADDDPLFVGRPGTIAQRGANFAIQNCDFMLSIGARLDRVVTGYSPEGFARAARKAMVDIDPAELRKMGPTIHFPVCADAGEFIRAMLAQASQIVKKDRIEWKRRCADWRARYPLVLPEHRSPEKRVSVYNFADVMSDILEEGDFCISGSSGTGIEVFLLAFRTKNRQRIFHTTALGAMGFGLPAAIGAGIVGADQSGRNIVCVDGDGGFQFNIQELETVRRLQLPVKFFVLNNEGYGSIRASQTTFFGECRIGCDSATGQTLPDVRRVAEAYGIATDVIQDQRNLESDIRRVLATPGPIVCDVHVELDEIRQPRLSSMQRPDGSFVSKPLEDLWPFLDREEFRANMLIPIIEE
ncbi:thiamine pyrophosphate-binding protein [Acidobacteria bacterium AB60]|nr:thiamine pyrophosphate-binding protein [Acidobacteria bacterium AB60]